MATVHIYQIGYDCNYVRSSNIYKQHGTLQNVSTCRKMHRRVRFSETVTDSVMGELNNAHKNGLPINGFVILATSQQNAHQQPILYFLFPRPPFPLSLAQITRIYNKHN